MKTTWKVTKKCFVGNEGDIIEYDSEAWCREGGWVNKTQNTQGSPFYEFDCVEEVRE